MLTKAEIKALRVKGLTYWISDGREFSLDLNTLLEKRDKLSAMGLYIRRNKEVYYLTDCHYSAEQGCSVCTSLPLFFKAGSMDQLEMHKCYRPETTFAPIGSIIDLSKITDDYLDYTDDLEEEMKYVVFAYSGCSFVVRRKSRLCDFFTATIPGMRYECAATFSVDGLESELVRFSPHPKLLDVM